MNKKASPDMKPKKSMQLMRLSLTLHSHLPCTCIFKQILAHATTTASVLSEFNKLFSPAFGQLIHGVPL